MTNYSKIFENENLQNDQNHFRSQVEQKIRNIMDNNGFEISSDPDEMNRYKLFDVHINNDKVNFIYDVSGGNNAISNLLAELETQLHASCDYDDDRKKLFINIVMPAKKQLDDVMQTLANNGCPYQTRGLPLRQVPEFRKISPDFIVKIFSHFNVTNLNDITAIFHPQDQVLNLQRWIRGVGTNLPISPETTEIFKTYLQAKIQLWEAFGYKYLFVRDPVGFYIYCWPK